MITKGQAIGGGAVVLGSGATVGGVLGTQGSGRVSSKYFDNARSAPEYSLLTYENNFSSTYSDGTIGKKYGWYLVGTYGRTSTTESSQELKDNQKWWEYSYSRWKGAFTSGKNSLSDEFKNYEKIKSPFSSSTDSEANDSKALNKVCESIYKKQISTIEFKQTANDEKSKLGDDLLSYCSPLGSSPATVSISTELDGYDSDSWGKDKKDKLVSIKDFGAQYNFWPLRDDEFFGKKGENGIGSGLNSSEDSLFYALYAKKDNRSENDTVRNVCEEVYKLKKSESNTKVKEENLLKFCSWDYK